MTGLNCGSTGVTPFSTSDVEIAIIEQDIGRLAAEFLANALHRRRRLDRNVDARSRRPGERDRVDFRMRRHRRADARPITVDEIEHALRHARFLEDLGNQQRRERRHL